MSERRSIYSSVSARAIRRARDAPFVKSSGMWTYGRMVGMCGYTAVPEVDVLVKLATATAPVCFRE